jgi:hypothetical protein
VPAARMYGRAVWMTHGWYGAQAIDIDESGPTRRACSRPRHQERAAAEIAAALGSYDRVVYKELSA